MNSMEPQSHDLTPCHVVDSEYAYPTASRAGHTLKTKIKPLPAHDRILELLDYRADEGLLYWRVNRGGAVKAGDIAFINKRTDGYFVGSIDGLKYAAHRVIWKYVHGVDPLHIDHIDGNRENNRIENLRSVNPTANLRNRRLSSNNTSGVCGVSSRQDGKWRASITLSEKAIVLGDFKTKDEAIAARKAVEKVLGFSSRHGERV